MFHAHAFRSRHFRVDSTFIQQPEFHHELAPVAYAEAEGVGAAVEFAECFLCRIVPTETACPSFCRTEHVAVGETAAEHYHIDIFQCLASAHQVGHVDVLDIETGEVEGVGHFTVTVHALFADNCRTGCSFAHCMAVGDAA